MLQRMSWHFAPPVTPPEAFSPRSRSPLPRRKSNPGQSPREETPSQSAQSNSPPGLDEDFSEDILTIKIRSDGVETPVKIHKSHPVASIKLLFTHSDGKEKVRLSYMHVDIAAHTLMHNFRDKSWLHLDYVTGNRAGELITAYVKRTMLQDLMQYPFVYKAGQCPDDLEGQAPPSLVRGKNPLDVLVMVPDGRTAVIPFRGFIGWSLGSRLGDGESYGPPVAAASISASSRNMGPLAPSGASRSWPCQPGPPDYILKQLEKAEASGSRTVENADPKAKQRPLKKPPPKACPLKTKGPVKKVLRKASAIVKAPPANVKPGGHKEAMDDSAEDSDKVTVIVEPETLVVIPKAADPEPPKVEAPKVETKAKPREKPVDTPKEQVVDVDE